jgi:mannose-6-phosphate isomerase-like protein (cupin superfamily)
MDENSDPRQGATTVRSQRPWGDIHMLVRNQICSVDLTHVNAGQRASLHAHQMRYELFHFIDEGAYLELDGEVFRPKAHEEFLIRPGVKHRFWTGENPFRMLVICFGKWAAEDQYRFEDDYGREGTALSI